mmetsp:Transcript_31457/g.47033  ORF Transcript_31457/g.47033 Transcript_31457/m.47033 type:complete len:235 (+) Transcript_31457:164-868(+)
MTIIHQIIPQLSSKKFNSMHVVWCMCEMCTRTHTETSWKMIIPKISMTPHTTPQNNIQHPGKKVLYLLSNLLVGNNLLNTNSSLDSDTNLVLSIIPSITNFLSHVLRVSRKINIGLLVSPLIHKCKLIIISNIDDFPLGTDNDGDSSSVGGGNHIFKLLSGEDVDGEEVTFGVAVLSGLGDGDAEDLAGLSLDHDVASLLDLTSFHRNGGRGTGVGTLDVVFVIRHGGVRFGVY